MNLRTSVLRVLSTGWTRSGLTLGIFVLIATLSVTVVARAAPTADLPENSPKNLKIALLRDPSFYLKNKLPNLSSHLPTYENPQQGLADRGVGALMGLAVGDAVGVALEFQPRPMELEDVITDMVGHPTLYGGMRPGEWTDDTSMALAMGESLLNYTEFYSGDILYKWNLWQMFGYMNVKNFRDDRTGQQKFEPAFDIGNTTRHALSLHYRSGGTTQLLPGETLNLHGHSTPSNGSIMRLAPVAIFYQESLTDAVDFGSMQSRLTHGHPAAVDASRVLAHMLVTAIHGASKEDVLSAKDFDFHTFSKDPLSQKIQAFFLPQAKWRHKTRQELVTPPRDSSGGSAEFTMECALWAVAKTDNFRDAILLAINLGKDADTVGAVVGQIAGALYGNEAIPTEWKTRLIRWSDIELMGRTLLEMGQARVALDRAAESTVESPIERPTKSPIESPSKSPAKTNDRSDGITPIRIFNEPEPQLLPKLGLRQPPIGPTH